MEVNEKLVRENGNQAAAVMADYASQGDGGGSPKITIVPNRRYAPIENSDGANSAFIGMSYISDSVVNEILTSEYTSEEEARKAAKQLGEILAHYGEVQIVTRLLTEDVTNEMYVAGAMDGLYSIATELFYVMAVSYEGKYCVDVYMYGPGTAFIKHKLVEQAYYYPFMFINTDAWPSPKIMATLEVGVQYGQFYGLTQEVLSTIDTYNFEKPEIRVNLHEDSVGFFYVTMTDCVVISADGGYELRAWGFYNVDGTVRQITVIVNAEGSNVTVE